MALGSIYFFLENKRKLLVAVLLIGLSLLPLISHLIAKNSISVHQHATLSLIFVLPLVGAFFAFIIKKYRYLGITMTLFTVILSLLLSLPMVKEIQESWPNSEKAIAVIKNNINSKDRILTEADDVIILAFYDELPRTNIVGPFYFEYGEVEGITAYKNAIEDDFFKFIQLDGTIFTEEELEVIERALGDEYKSVFFDGNIEIYQHI